MVFRAVLRDAYGPDSFRSGIAIKSDGLRTKTASADPDGLFVDPTSSKRARYELVRRFGYGVPSFDRARASAPNHLALFAQATIQPFKMDRGRKFNECHYYRLPIPPSMLEELENEIIEMKVGPPRSCGPETSTAPR
jgi:hypothetical protein